MSKLKALILDAGGVLVRPIHGNWNIPARYRDFLGADADTVSSEAYRTACAAEADLLREDIFISGMEEEYARRLEFLRRVGARMHWKISDEAYAALAQDFTWNPDRYIWYADVPIWLPRWSRRMRLGILSDSMPSFRHVVEGHPCAADLHALVISTEIGAGKPDARMYQTAADRLGIAPEECLFVDDREGNLQGARKIGMRALRMNRDAAAPAAEAVRNLEELNAYMEGLF